MRQVIVKHTQTIRQSHAYQSMEVSYGIEIPCENTPEEIKAARIQATRFVEEAIGKKMKQQRELLVALGKGRNNEAE